MKSLTRFFLPLLFLPSMGLAMAHSERKANLPFRGIALSIYVHQTQEEIQKALNEIQDIGANSVLIKISEVQTGTESDSIRPDPAKTLPLNTLRYLLRESVSRGFHVVLMPIVLIEKPRTKREWRGVIRPESVDQWFESYRQMILKYARVARDEKIQIFSTGSELVSMERYESQWLSLIQEIREVFKGHLLYSANWDHLLVSSAWRKLDYLGLTGYFELSKKGEDPSLEELNENWGEILPSIESWSKKLKKKIILTEVGYPSREGALADPWDHTRVDKPNEDLQAKAIESVIQSWSESERVEGILFYEWYGEGGEADGGYTPKGKKAEKVLRRFFRGF